MKWRFVHIGGIADNQVFQFGIQKARKGRSFRSTTAREKRRDLRELAQREALPNDVWPMRIAIVISLAELVSYAVRQCNLRRFSTSGKEKVSRVFK